jgi:hypothetical protein
LRFTYHFCPPAGKEIIALELRAGQFLDMAADLASLPRFSAR